MAVLIMRAYRYLTGGDAITQGAAADFRDASDISSWAVEDVSAAVRLQLLEGLEDQLFKPKERLSRAQAAQVLANIINNLGLV